MHECFHLGCNFTSSDEYYVSLHQQIDHSIFHAGPMRELLGQILEKLGAKREGLLEMKIPRSRIVAAENGEREIEKLVSEDSSRRVCDFNFIGQGREPIKKCPRRWTRKIDG